jgi:hypothetical protein
MSCCQLGLQKLLFSLFSWLMVKVTIPYPLISMSPYESLIKSRLFQFPNNISSFRSKLCRSEVLTEKDDTLTRVSLDNQPIIYSFQAEISLHTMCIVTKHQIRYQKTLIQ